MSESEARQRAREDWQNESTNNNPYPKASIESLAYQAEFMKVSGLFNECGSMYESC